MNIKTGVTYAFFRLFIGDLINPFAMGKIALFPILLVDTILIHSNSNLQAEQTSSSWEFSDEGRVHVACLITLEFCSWFFFLFTRTIHMIESTVKKRNSRLNNCNQPATICILFSHIPSLSHMRNRNFLKSEVHKIHDFSIALCNFRKWRRVLLSAFKNF